MLLIVGVFQKSKKKSEKDCLQDIPYYWSKGLTAAYDLDTKRKVAPPFVLSSYVQKSGDAWTRA